MEQSIRGTAAGEAGYVWDPRVTAPVRRVPKKEGWHDHAMTCAAWWIVPHTSTGRVKGTR